MNLLSDWTPMSSVWTTKATGGAHGLDRAEVLRALSILMDPDQTFELRGVQPGVGAHSRICKGQDLPAAVQAAWELSDHPGLYFSLNPLRHDLTDSARVKDVLCRRWLLVDIDTIRPDGQNATDTEKAESSKVVGCILDYTASIGWPFPVVCDSGNGWHLLFRVDLPNDKLSQQLAKAILAELGKRFDTRTATIDRAVHDAARICKLPGSFVRKGPNSDGRPHRLARVVYTPEEFHVVTVDQLQALANASKVEPPKYSPWTTYATNGHLEAYCRSAIERECGRLCMSQPGERNNVLNIAAFSLGTAGHWPEMIGQNPQASLAAAARQSGLQDWEIATTIRSGWEAGLAKPRPRPAEQNGKPHVNGVTSRLVLPGQKLTIRLKNIKPEKVNWLYENRVAPGFISIFAGRTGFGKSFVTCDIVAKLSNGWPAPFSGLNHTPVRTLFISEDSPALVIAPRLISLGADQDMVDFMTWDALAGYTLADTELLERAYQECGQPGLVVIDPPSSFLGETDEHRNAEVRGILKLLTAWLDTKRVACIFITHINKQIGKGLDAVERIIGSVAWGSVARVTLSFVKDPEVPEQYLFGGTKNNLGPLADTLAYKFVQDSDGVTIEWVGKSEQTMENALNQVQKKSRGVVATEWLEERFRERIEWESSELKRLATEAGVSKNALWSPEVNALPIDKKKRTNAEGEIYYVWRAIGEWPNKIVGNPGKAGNPEPQPY